MRNKFLDFLKGFLVRQTTTEHTMAQEKKMLETVMFLEPTDIKRSFDSADTIEDFLKGLK